MYWVLEWSTSDGRVVPPTRVKGRLYTSFQPRSTDATVTWNLSWDGTLLALALASADAAAEVTITVRVYEIIPGSGSSTVGATVFERIVHQEDNTAALQGVSLIDVIGNNTQSVVLPRLDLGKFYRLEAELHCSTRVAFVLSATTCGFEGASDPSKGLIVNDWSIRFDNVPAT